MIIDEDSIPKLPYRYSWKLEWYPCPDFSVSVRIYLRRKRRFWFGYSTKLVGTSHGDPGYSDFSEEDMDRTLKFMKRISEELLEKKMVERFTDAVNQNIPLDTDNPVN